MTNKGISKIDEIFEEYYCLTKSIILDKNKVCYRNIKKLNIEKCVVKTKADFSIYKISISKLYIIKQKGINQVLEVLV